MGRTLSPEDDILPRGHPVLVVSERFWKADLAETPDVVGRKIYVNGNLFTIVGVMPESFRGTYAALSSDFWAPMVMYAQVRPRGVDINQRGWGWLTGSGRLKPGATLAEAQAELEGLSRQLREEHPEVNRAFGFEIFPAGALPEAQQEAVSRLLGFFLGASGLVLFVACANLATVFLARMATRRREVALRLCLGAGRGQLMRQWLAEAFVIAFVGAGPGVVLAGWFRSAVPQLLPPARLRGPRSRRCQASGLRFRRRPRDRNSGRLGSRHSRGASGPGLRPQAGPECRDLGYAKLAPLRSPSRRSSSRVPGVAVPGRTSRAEFAASGDLRPRLPRRLGLSHHNRPEPSRIQRGERTPFF